MTRPVSFQVLRVSFVAVAVALTLNGCSYVQSMVSGDSKIDYRTATSSGAKSSGLEVPPDLTQLTKDSRYQQSQGSSISAAAYQSTTPMATTSTVQSVTVAQQSIGDLKIERLGNERWLRTGLKPEQLWPQLQAFWRERGFVIVQDQPAVGVMETDWAENRAKLPQDLIRSTIGKVFDGAYATGELDKFRTRVERDGDGSDVYITHRGMEEIYTGQRKDMTSWQPRGPDPQLEGELLSRLMLRLGGTEEAAKTEILATATTVGAPGRARLLIDRPSATVQVDDSFDRAWRRVGVALDRSGFTVEDRDRSQGLYYVRYIDPALAGKEEPGFFAKLFTFGKKDDSGLARYRVSVKADGDRCTVSVLNAKGEPENGEAGKRISTMLLDELK